MRNANRCDSRQLRAFLRELFEIIELQALCQGESKVTDSIPRQGIAQRKNIKQRPAKLPGPLGRAEDESSGWCNGFVLSRDSLQGSGALSNLTRSSEPASYFPYRAALKVHQEAPLLILQLFESSTGCSRLQPRNSRSCNFSRIATDQVWRKGRRCGKRANLWESVT
jgi:hypothetical protein